LSKRFKKILIVLGLGEELECLDQAISQDLILYGEGVVPHFLKARREDKEKSFLYYFFEELYHTFYHAEEKYHLSETVTAKIISDLKMKLMELSKENKKKVKKELGGKDNEHVSKKKRRKKGG